MRQVDPIDEVRDPETGLPTSRPVSPTKRKTRERMVIAVAVGIVVVLILLAVN